MGIHFYKRLERLSLRMAASVENFLHSFNTKFEAPVRSHLKNVYATPTMSIMAASAGAYVHLFTDILKGGGLIFSLLGAGIALGLFMTPDNGKNRGTRLSMLMAFAFLTGLGLGPLLSMAIMVNPSLVPSAFMLTSAIFACFTGAALFAPDGKSLYLGGTLLVLGFLNIFFRSQLLFQAHLYIGLAIFCGF